MTELLLDLASYQAGIDLSLPAYRDWSKINIKTSQGNWYVANRARSRAWADQARALGKGIATFHWLDASDTGANQARIAFREMRELGGPDGMAHQADTEDSGQQYGALTYRIWADYVTEMQQLMGRHVISYTGDWWWQDPRRDWYGADLTPYLWAAPNNGYLSSYPGDQSSDWNAGYGGWLELAAMQFRVGPIPGGGPGADSVSMTAIRDPRVWAALTGGQTTMSAFSDNFLYTLSQGIPRFVDENKKEYVNCPVEWEISREKREAEMAANVAQLKAQMAIVAEVVRQGSGNPDVTALMTKMDAETEELKAYYQARRAEDRASVELQHAARIQALEAELAALRGTAPAAV